MQGIITHNEPGSERGTGNRSTFSVINGGDRTLRKNSISKDFSEWQDWKIFQTGKGPGGSRWEGCGFRFLPTGRGWRDVQRQGTRDSSSRTHVPIRTQLGEYLSYNLNIFVPEMVSAQLFIRLMRRNKHTVWPHLKCRASPGKSSERLVRAELTPGLRQGSCPRFSWFPALSRPCLRRISAARES